MKWRLFGFGVFICAAAQAGGGLARNPPSACQAPDGQCPCATGEGAQNRCVKVSVDMGATTPWTGSRPCALKVFSDDQSPQIFTPESLYAVCGYTFKRLGNGVLSDGTTPAEVVLAHPKGESVRFVFSDGESTGRPDPGFHIPMDERLMMVDAQGWACTRDPVYYDLYETDGTVRRFLATDRSNARGRLVSITDPRGNVTTPGDLGIDVVYGPDGVRQFLTPSRLADVAAGASGYTVTVYPVQDPPEKDPATGLYPLPEAVPVQRVSVVREADGRRAVVTIRRGEGEPMRHVYEYVRNDWSLTRPSGVEERQDRMIDDSRCARTVKETYSRSRELLSRDEYNYIWTDWGFAATNHVEGFGDVTATTEWTYYTSGNGKGQVKAERRPSGLLIQYAYDNLDRIVSETRSGPDMMTEVATYSYVSVDPSDVVPPVDTRPRTVVKTLDGIECERTYYVYSPLTNIVERVGTQGASYGGTNALRTVTAFYPVAANGARSGFVASIRHEDGKLDLYDYSLVSNLWIETVTHLHEQSPAPVSGKTTRDTTTTNARGEILEQKTEAYMGEDWHIIARNRMTYNAEGKRMSRENLAGQVTTTAWDCCHKVSETAPDGSTTTWDYDDEGRVIATSRLIPLDMTNLTWLTTCYEYDALGRHVATWQTNLAAKVGLPVERTRYDQLGRVVARVDQLGNTTTTEYSADGRTTSVRNPNTATVVYSRNADGDTLSITGTAVTPEFHTYGILPDGTRWAKTVEGETASSPRFTKRYENLLGQTIREERSGFQGAVLATTHAYDAFGRLVSTSADYEPTTDYTYDTLGNRIAKTSRTGGSPVQWRRTSTESSFSLDGAIVWLTQTNIVSCSDSAIAPLVTSSARQLTGLTSALPSRSRSFDIRGNVTENERLVDSSIIISRQTLPYATNKPLSISRYGVSLMDVSVSAVTNTASYDSLGRQIANTDGRGNTRHTEYNSLGQRSASIDALGNRTTYAYDQFGNLVSVTDPLGHTTIYEYDLRGRKTYEGGATYPVRYTYDVFGNKTSMMTYRDESLGPNSGDVTTWLYDEASNCMTNKVYADGKGPTYFFATSGRLARRIWARGIATDYAYDGWGNPTNTVYSDDTHGVSRCFDALGRQTEIRDAAGTTALYYDAFGSLTNEIVISGTQTNAVGRSWDVFGRMTAYTLNGVRQAMFDYDEATSRIASMLPYDLVEPFEWSYIQGSYLKSELLYPCGLAAFWRYGVDGQVECVSNGFPSNVVSRYDVAYDDCLRKRRVEMRGSAMDAVSEISFEYNSRGEVTDFYKRNLELPGRFEVSYRYDDSGNRKHVNFSDLPTWYSYNEMGQCTNKFSYGSDVSPTYDSDGNMTIQDAAGGRMWSIAYDGENRPVLWRSAVTNLVMMYDSRGRRVSLTVTENGVAVVRHVYIYNGYQCIADLASNGESLCYLWDPTEPVAARALFARRGNGQDLVYTHDCRKNVSDVVDVNTQGVVAHYEYDAFGEIGPIYPLRDQVRRGELRYINPWRWSSEYADDITGNVYYNYRHYSPLDGRWLSRDPVENVKASMPYIAANNDMVNKRDILGLSPLPEDAQLVAEAKRRCQSMIDGSKHVKTVLSDEQITPEAKSACMGKVNAALGEPVVSDVVSEFGEGCEMPKLDCGCCSSFTMANSGEKRGIRGYWDPRIKTVMFCWNNYNDKEIKPFNLAKTIAHELTHSLQRCGRDGRGCLSSIKKEIEARKCAKQCGSFEECFLNALESSCFMGTHCNNSSEAANYMSELRQWFMEMSNERNSLGFCKFGFGGKSKGK